ncbi:MAG: hypothetical protein ABSF09_10565 [Candidatus Bathyarchaeia archaeon]|jgi:membrane-bound ClpP family serine protease
MYRGLVVSGSILFVFGTFLISIDLYAPMGVSGFGLPILVIGVIMFFIGFWSSEPEPVEAEAGKKFCWYCMSQIPLDAKECSNCSLPQHDASN